MLTRIEIDGFKTFDGFVLDLAPFAAVLGVNATGKSNLFDALQFMAKIAERDLREALQEMRGLPDEMFRFVDGKAASRMRFAVEVLLNPRITDPWGERNTLTQTRLRYEVVIARRDSRGIERLVVEEERAEPIRAGTDAWKPYGRKPSKSFRTAFMKYNRKPPLLETADEGPSKKFIVHQDGRQGRKRRFPATNAEATVLSSITSANEFPHLYALREELRSWHFLQPDPAALRRPSPMTAPTSLLADGSNLAAVLAHIQAETATPDRQRGDIPTISAALSDIIPGITGFDVRLDEHRRENQLEFSTRDGSTFTSRVASDGTLRVLALLTLLHDPVRRGLICFEEPENGIHPARLVSLIGYLLDSVADVHGDDESVDEEEPLAQLIVNSHSPTVLRAVRGHDNAQILYSDLVTTISPATGARSRKTLMSDVNASRQDDLPFGPPSPTRQPVSSAWVMDYLETTQSESGA